MPPGTPAWAPCPEIRGHEGGCREPLSAVRLQVPCPQLLPPAFSFGRGGVVLGCPLSPFPTPTAGTPISLGACTAGTITVPPLRQLPITDPMWVDDVRPHGGGTEAGNTACSCRRSRGREVELLAPLLGAANVPGVDSVFCCRLHQLEAPAGGIEPANVGGGADSKSTSFDKDANAAKHCNALVPC